MIYYLTTLFIYLVAGISLGFWFRKRFALCLIIAGFLLPWVMWETGAQLNTPEITNRWQPVFSICGVILGTIIGWVAQVPDFTKDPKSSVVILTMISFILAINGVWLFLLSFLHYIDTSFPWTVMIALGIHIVGTGLVMVGLEVVNYISHGPPVQMRGPMLYWFVINIVLLLLYLMQLSPSLSIQGNDVNFTGAVTAITAVIVLMMIGQKIYSSYRYSGKVSVQGLFDGEDDEEDNTEGYEAIEKRN